MERKRKKDSYYYGKDHFFVMILLSCLLLLSTLVLTVESFNVEPTIFYGGDVVWITLDNVVADPSQLSVVLRRSDAITYDVQMEFERSISDLIHVFSFDQSTQRNPPPRGVVLTYQIVVDNYNPVQVYFAQSSKIIGFSTSHLLTDLQNVEIDIYGENLIPIASFSDVIEVFFVADQIQDIPCIVQYPIADTTIRCTLASTPNTPTTLLAKIKYQSLYNPPADYIVSITSIYVNDYLILTGMNPIRGYSGQAQAITFTANVNINRPIDNLQVVFVQVGGQFSIVCQGANLLNGLVTCTLPIIPNIAPGSYLELRPDVSYGTLNRAPAPFTYVTSSASQIGNILSRKLIISGSEYVTITGTFFDHPTLLTIDGVVCTIQQPTTWTTITCLTGQFNAENPSATLSLTIGNEVIQLQNAFEIARLHIMSVPSFALYDSNTVPVTTTMRIGFTGVIPDGTSVRVICGASQFTPSTIRVISNILSFEVSSAGFTDGASCQIAMILGTNGPTNDLGLFTFKKPIITVDQNTFQSFIFKSNKAKINLKTNVDGETFVGFAVDLLLVIPAGDTIVAKGNVLPDNIVEFNVPSYSLDTTITSALEATCKTIRIDKHDYTIPTQNYRYTVPKITQVEFKSTGFEIKGDDLNLIGQGFTTKFMLDDIVLGQCAPSSNTLVVCTGYGSSTQAKTIRLIVNEKTEFKFDLSTGAGITIVGPVATEIKPRLSHFSDRSSITIKGTGFTAQSLVTVGGLQVAGCNSHVGTTNIICPKPLGLEPNDDATPFHEIKIDGVVQSDISYMVHVVSCLGQSISSSIDPGQHYDYLPKKWWFNYRLATTNDDYLYADEGDQNLRSFTPLNTHTDPATGIKDDEGGGSHPYGHTKGFVIWQEHNSQVYGVHVLHSNPAFPPNDYFDPVFTPDRLRYIGKTTFKQHYFCRSFVGLDELDKVGDYIIINNAFMYKKHVPGTISDKMKSIHAGDGTTFMNNCDPDVMGPTCLKSYDASGDGKYFAKTSMKDTMPLNPLLPAGGFPILPNAGVPTHNAPTKPSYYPTQYLHQQIGNNQRFLTFYTNKHEKCVAPTQPPTLPWENRYCYPITGVDTWEYAARTLGSQLFVQTFRKGPALIPSPYLVNVYEKIIHPDTKKHKDSADHAKIAYTFRPTSRGGTTGDWFCVGDSNRAFAQVGRGGGVFCLQAPTLVDQFHSAIIGYKSVAPINPAPPPNTMVEYGVSHTENEHVVRSRSTALSIQLNTVLGFQNPVTVELYESVSYQAIPPVFQEYKLLPFDVLSFIGTKRIRYNAIRTDVAPATSETPFSQIADILPIGTNVFTPPEELVAEQALKVKYYANDDLVASVCNPNPPNHHCHQLSHYRTDLIASSAFRPPRAQYLISDIVDYQRIHHTWLIQQKFNSLVQSQLPNMTKVKYIIKQPQLNTISNYDTQNRVIVLNVAGNAICQEEQTYLLLLAYYHNRTIQEPSQLVTGIYGNLQHNSQKTFVNGILLALTRYLHNQAVGSTVTSFDQCFVLAQTHNLANLQLGPDDYLKMASAFWAILNANPSLMTFGSVLKTLTTIRVQDEGIDNFEKFYAKQENILKNYIGLFRTLELLPPAPNPIAGTARILSSSSSFSPASSSIAHLLKVLSENYPNNYDVDSITRELYGSGPVQSTYYSDLKGALDQWINIQDKNQGVQTLFIDILSNTQTLGAIEMLDKINSNQHGVDIDIRTSQSGIKFIATLSTIVQITTLLVSFRSHPSTLIKRYGNDFELYFVPVENGDEGFLVATLNNKLCDLQKNTRTNFELSTPDLSNGICRQATDIITSVTPLSGSTVGGFSINVGGIHFSSNSKVKIGKTICESTLFISTTMLQCIVPHGIGNNHIVSTGSSSSSGLIGLTRFHFNYFQPTIIGIQSPTLVSNLITITGNYFGNNALYINVKVGDSDCDIVSIQNDRIICKPTSNDFGIDRTVSIQSTNPNSNSNSLYTTNLNKANIDTSLVSFRPPIIHSVSPSTTVHVGETIYLYGKYFGLKNSDFGPHVTINKQKCQVLDYSPEVITFIVPKGSGSSQIVVNVGGQTATMPVTYDIPYVDFVTPKLFNTSGGQVMRIQGDSLGSSIYDIDSINFYLQQPIQCQPFNLLMECTIPAGVGKDIPLTGTINGKTMIPWNTKPILASYLPPSIASAAKLTGNQLSIKGCNFVGSLIGTSASVVLYTNLQSQLCQLPVFKPNDIVTCTSPFVASATGVVVIIQGQESDKFNFDVSIVGRVYLDRDNNNMLSQGDQNIDAQVVVTLTSTDGQFTQSLITTTSEYMFAGIPPGDYKIKATSPGILFPRDTFAVSLIAGSGTRTLDFGGYTKVGTVGTVTYNQETLNIQNNMNVGVYGWCYTTECQTSYSYNIPSGSTVYISTTTGQVYLYTNTIRIYLYEDKNLNLVFDQATEPLMAGLQSTVADGPTIQTCSGSGSVCTVYCTKGVCTVTPGASQIYTSIYGSIVVEFNTMSLVDQQKDIYVAYFGKAQYPRSTQIETTSNGVVTLPLGTFSLAMASPMTRVIPTSNTLVTILHQGVTYSYTQTTIINLSPSPTITVSVSPLGILQGIVLSPYGQSIVLTDIPNSITPYISVNDKIESFACQPTDLLGVFRYWTCTIPRLRPISPNARIYVKTNDWLLNSYPVSLTTVTVSGLVFHDTNLNGIYEIGEKIIPGVRLEIYNVSSSFTFSTSTGYTMQTNSFNYMKAINAFGPTAEYPTQTSVAFYPLGDSPSKDFTSYTSINVPIRKINVKCNGYLISGTNQIEFFEGTINLSNYAGWCLEGQTCQYPITSVSMPSNCIRLNNSDNTITIIEGINIRVDLYDDVFIRTGLPFGVFQPLAYPMLVRTSFVYQGREITVEKLSSSMAIVPVSSVPGQLTTLSIVAPPQSSHQYSIMNDIKVNPIYPIYPIEIGVATKSNLDAYVVLYDVLNTSLTLPMGVYDDVLTRLSWNSIRARKLIISSPDVVVLIFKNDMTLIGPFSFPPGSTNNVFTIPVNTYISVIEVAHKTIFNTIVPTEGGLVQLPANPFQSRSLSLHMEGVQLKCSESLFCLFPTLPASDRQLVVKLQPGNIQLYTTYTITYPVRYSVPTVPSTYLDSYGPNKTLPITFGSNARLSSISIDNYRYTNVLLRSQALIIESVENQTATVINSFAISSLSYPITVTMTNTSFSVNWGSSSKITFIEGVAMRYFSTHPDGAMVQDELGRVLWARFRASITEYSMYGPLGSGLGYLDCLDPTRNTLSNTQTIGNGYYSIYVQQNYGFTLKDGIGNQMWTGTTFLPTVQTKLVFYADGDLCSVNSAGVKGWCTYTAGLGGRYFLVAPYGYVQGHNWMIFMLNANGHVVWARHDGSTSVYMLPGSYMVAGQALRNGQFLTNGLVYMVYDATAGYIKYHREPPGHPNKIPLSQTQCIGNILLLSGTTPQCFNDQDPSQLSTVTTTLAYWGIKPGPSINFETRLKTAFSSSATFIDHSFSPILQDLIQGQVFIDLNRNNIMDQNEVGLLGVAVSIGVSSTTTDLGGFFSLRSHQSTTEKLKFINIPSQYYTPIPELTLYQIRFNRDIPLYQKGNCYGYLNSSENSKLYLDVGTFRLSDFGWCTLNKACANRMQTYSFPDQCLVMFGDNNNFVSISQKTFTINLYIESISSPTGNLPLSAYNPNLLSSKVQIYVAGISSPIELTPNVNTNSYVWGSSQGIRIQVTTNPGTMSLLNNIHLVANLTNNVIFNVPMIKTSRNQDLTNLAIFGHVNQSAELILPPGHYTNTFIGMLGWINRPISFTTSNTEMQVYLFGTSGQPITLTSRNGTSIPIPTNLGISQIQIAPPDTSFSMTTKMTGGYYQFTDPFPLGVYKSLYVGNFSTSIACSEQLLCYIPPVGIGNQLLFIQVNNVILNRTFTITYNDPTPSPPTVYLEQGQSIGPLATLRSSVDSQIGYSEISVTDKLVVSIYDGAGNILNSSTILPVSLIAPYTAVVTNTGICLKGTGVQLQCGQFNRPATNSNSKVLSLYPQGIFYHSNGLPTSNFTWAYTRPYSFNLYATSYMSTGITYLDVQSNPTLKAGNFISNGFQFLKLTGSGTVVKLTVESLNQEVWSYETSTIFPASGVVLEITPNNLCMQGIVTKCALPTFPSNINPMLRGRYLFLAPKGTFSGLEWALLFTDLYGNIIWGRYAMALSVTQFFLPGSYLVPGQILRPGEILSNGYTLILFTKPSSQLVKYYMGEWGSTAVGGTSNLLTIPSGHDGCYLSGTSLVSGNTQSLPSLVPTTAKLYGIQAAYKFGSTYEMNPEIILQAPTSQVHPQERLAKRKITIGGKVVIVQSAQQYVGLSGITVTYLGQQTVTNELGEFLFDIYSQPQASRFVFSNIPSNIVMPISSFPVPSVSDFNKMFFAFSKSSDTRCSLQLESEGGETMQIQMGTVDLSLFGWCYQDSCAFPVTDLYPSYSNQQKCRSTFTPNNNLELSWCDSC
ncbi:hypothetical protein DFA_06771 [Cavenderia fasciculata]|uniref:IPT/TIG domain-containing protein n=1 Tax=Cavenderia fasciculata TaxID=261658 RepID=F4Q284_CACFS|nr:uncharacterized protein DFA_06771 [Cavenderia fasciculata]EGG18104.1 hypothetical protein DFA_06771 [Cavenderia fasciculata]|eukprot:XP_004366145.1 hypothetical protein DFA_06771 [Cavenderia fasciculata]